MTGSDGRSARMLGRLAAGWRASGSGGWAGLCTMMMAGPAIAEVCDKFDGNWHPGDPPTAFVNAYPGWQAFMHPFLFALLGVSFSVAILALTNRLHGSVALVLGFVWTLVAINYGTGVDDAVRGGIAEGCIALHWHNGMEFLAISGLIAAALIVQGLPDTWRFLKWTKG